MEVKLRKLWPLIGALCATMFSSAFAQSNYSSGSNSNSSSYESGVDSSSTSAQSGQGTCQRGTFREITPNAGPRVAHGADVFITADFIWWKASQEGINYAVTGFVTDDSGADSFSSASKGKYGYVGTDWAPGFKVGLGLSLSHDGWDLYSKYTWLHAGDNSSLSRTGGVAYPTSLLPFDDGRAITVDRIKANWDLHFNVIDLELGRNFYLSQFLTMRPFIGLKGTWQDQCLRVTTKSRQSNIDSNNQNNPVTGPFFHTRDIGVRGGLWGIGVRGGLNVSWYMSKSWSIYGDLAWTTMWTDYDKLTRSDTLYDSATCNSKTYFNVSNDDIHAVKYIGEMELGLRWEVWFYDDNYHFAIQAGWEQQVWVNWGQFFEVLDHSNRDLSLHGLNLKFRFDF